MVTDDMRAKWHDQCETIFGASEVGQMDFNDWEADFFDSIYEQVINQNKDLSWKQQLALTKLYNKIG